MIIDCEYCLSTQDICIQHQISPCNINAYSIPEVMRIKDMISLGEFSGNFNNFSPILLEEKYGDKIG